MNAEQFITKYNNNTFKDEYKNRQDFLEYFKKTYPEEYIKYREITNQKRREYLDKMKVEDPEKYEIYRINRNKVLLKHYYNNKTWYKNYYKQYIKNPINREKNRKRASEWYWNNKDKQKKNYKVKEHKLKEYKVKSIKKDINYKENTKKPAIIIEKLKNKITIDFSI